jgi:hypothetical protein
MKKYKDFAPTSFDSKGAFLPEQGEWLVVPVGQNRDSGCLDRSNFRTALEILGGEQENLVEVHRFGHWGPGWFEIIIVHPSLEAQVKAIEDKLENYLVLDYEDYSTLEWEAAEEYWEQMSISDRIDVCNKYNVSIFAARRSDEIPENVEISYLTE